MPDTQPSDPDPGKEKIPTGTVPPDPRAAEIETLSAIYEGTAARVGQDFLQSLVQHLATALNVEYAFVTEFLPAANSVRTLAFWAVDVIAPNIEWALPGTPCEDVIRGNLCHYSERVAQLFPADRPLAELGIESFLGVPLTHSTGVILGHLAVFDPRPMPSEPRHLQLFRIFAARAAAELERLRTSAELEESERRYRDLYEQAPIAYIYEDLESRFVRANAAACRLLGVRPEEVSSTYGVTLLAPTEETRRTVQAALDAMKNEGREFAAVELELRRKDDGRPVWVQWWSKPEPDGKHTRTMLVDITERVQLAQEKARVEQQNLYLREEIKQNHNFEEIVGQSAPLRATLDALRLVAPTDASVLITGETGTGKELVARALHSNSQRRDRPLIKVNCAALPSGLVESELFGHERGAFSGAISRHIGRFELAHGGTIFLDEVGEIPLDVQAKLLRVLQEREIERVGGSHPIRTDVRVIAATNRDLVGAIRAGTFREDLYYRLNVFPLPVPPLRERREDIPLLVRFLVSRAAGRIGRRIDAVDQATMNRLVEYPWPGNVREMENLLERAVILCPGSILEVGAELLTPPHRVPTKPASPGPDSTRRDNPPVTEPIRSLDEVQSEHLLAALNRSGWVIEGEAGAARMLNLHPNTLRSRMKRLGISRRTH